MPQRRRDLQRYVCFAYGTLLQWQNNREGKESRFGVYASEERNKKKMKMVVNISVSNVCIDYIGNVPMFWAHSGYCLKKYTFQLKCYNNNDCVTNEIKTSGFFFSLLLKSIEISDANAGKRTKHKHTIEQKSRFDWKGFESTRWKWLCFIVYCLPFLIYLNVNNWRNHAPNTELWAPRKKKY